MKRQPIHMGGCIQQIRVTAEDCRVKVRLYERCGGIWQEQRAFRVEGVCGAGGVTAHKREGDGCTPQGCFSIGEAFYIGTPPPTALDAFAITADTYWVDDTASPFYNRRVIGRDRLGGAHAERMMDYDEYRCGFVIEHNSACRRFAGSAIFFHILPTGRNTTAGCIAVPEEAVRRYLGRLDAECHPQILIEKQGKAQ